MKKKSTLVSRRFKSGRWYEVRADGTERLLRDKRPDWSRLDAMSDAEIEAAARSDPDAQPLTKAELKRMRRIPFAKQLRWAIGLSQGEFAERFRIPVGTLRDWEQGRAEPDQATRAYLEVIACDPEGVEMSLKRGEMGKLRRPPKSNVINLLDALRSMLSKQPAKPSRKARPRKRG